MRLVRRIAQAVEGDQGVDHRREDRAQAVATFQPLEDPLLAGGERPPAQRLDRQPAEPAEGPVDGAEEPAPGAGARILDRGTGRGPVVDQQLGDGRAPGTSRRGSLAADDGERHDDGARPARHAIEVERRPARQQHELRRDHRAALPRVLAEHRQIDLGERVAGLEAAAGADRLAGTCHVRRRRVVAEELEDEVRLRRGAHLGGPARIDRPAAARRLLPAQVDSRLAHSLAHGAVEEIERQDVLGLEDRVPFELTAPVPVRRLQRQKVALGGVDRGAQRQRIVEGTRREDPTSRLVTRYLLHAPTLASSRPRGGARRPSREGARGEPASAENLGVSRSQPLPARAWCVRRRADGGSTLGSSGLRRAQERPATVELQTLQGRL